MVVMRWLAPEPIRCLVEIGLKAKRNLMKSSPGSVYLVTMIK
jgi:hypothetical protein